MENHYSPRLQVEKENALQEGIKKREVYAKELLKEEPEEKESHEEELEDLLEEFFA